MADETTQPSEQTPQTPAEQTQPPTEPAAEGAAETAAEAPQNKVTIEDAGTLRKRITIEIPRASVDAKFDEMFGELGRTAAVPGFRLGHAPRRLIEKRFGKDVLTDVRNSLVGDALGKALEGTDLQPLGEPDLKLEDIAIPEGQDLKFSFEIEVAPQFTLPEYKGLEIKKPSLAITDKHVDDTMESYRKAYGRLAPVNDQPIQADDVLTADVKIAGDGVDHAHADSELRVAPAQIEGILVEDLPKALVGKKSGEQVTVQSKVPAAHATEAWRDKDVTITLTIKEVKRLELPAADDSFAKQIGFETLDQLRGFIRERLAAQAGVEQRRTMQAQVVKYFNEKVTIDLPPAMAERQSQRLLTRQVIDLMYRGVPRDQIEKNLEPLKVEAAKRAQAELKNNFILDKLAQAEKITVEEGEINSRVAQLARQSNRRPERLRQEMKGDGSLDELIMSMTEEKAIDKVLEYAKITEEAGQ